MSTSSVYLSRLGAYFCTKIFQAESFMFLFDIVSHCSVSQGLKLSAVNSHWNYQDSVKCTTSSCLFRFSLEIQTGTLSQWKKLESPFKTVTG